MTTIATGFVILFLLALWVRASPEAAVAIGTAIGMGVFAIYYPAGFGITMAVICLIGVVWVLFDFVRKAWLWSQRHK